MPERVLIIDFPEDVVRQSETGDVPPTMGGGSAGQPNLRRVFERFIEGLEGAPVRRPEFVDAPAEIAAAAPKLLVTAKISGPVKPIWR